MKESLFYEDNKLTCQLFLEKFSLQVSEKFIDCAKKQLTDKFIRLTGLKPGRLIGVVIAVSNLGDAVYSEYIDFSTQVGLGFLGRGKLNLILAINHHSNPVSIIWKSRSDPGKIFKPHHTEIDCNDIEFSFEKLDTRLYLNQFYPAEKIPLLHSNLSYELIVERININCKLELYFKDEHIAYRERFLNEFSRFIEKWNQESEKNKRKDGVIHNFNWELKKNEIVSIEIDLGSVDWNFFKKLLAWLSKLNWFLKVEIK